MQTENAKEDNAEYSFARMSSARRIIMLTSGIPTALCLSAVAPVLPKMESALAHDDTDRLLIKMIIGVVGVAMAIGAPAAGILADRMSRTTMITMAMILSAIIGSTGYFITDLKLMVATRLLAGIGAAAAITVGLTMIGDMPGHQTMRHRYTGLLVGISTTASILALPLAGYLGDIFWRLPFLLYLISLPFALLGLGEIGKDTRQSVHVTTKAVAHTAKLPLVYPIGTMLLAVIGGIIQYSALTYIAFRCRDLGITSAKAAGMALTAHTIVVGIASSLYGHVRGRVSSRAVFVISFTSSAIGAAGVALSTTYAPIIIFLVFSGVGTGLFVPNLVSRAGEIAPDDARGTFIGLTKGSNISASFISVLIMEPISHAVGIGGVFFVVAIIAFIAATAFASGFIKRPAVTLPSL